MGSTVTIPSECGNEKYVAIPVLRATNCFPKDQKTRKEFNESCSHLTAFNILGNPNLMTELFDGITETKEIQYAYIEENKIESEETYKF